MIANLKNKLEIKKKNFLILNLLTPVFIKQKKLLFHSSLIQRKKKKISFSLKFNEKQNIFVIWGGPKKVLGTTFFHTKYKNL